MLENHCALRCTPPNLTSLETRPNPALCWWFPFVFEFGELLKTEWCALSMPFICIITHVIQSRISLWNSCHTRGERECLSWTYCMCLTVWQCRAPRMLLAIKSIAKIYPWIHYGINNVGLVEKCVAERFDALKLWLSKACIQSALLSSHSLTGEILSILVAGKALAVCFTELMCFCVKLKLVNPQI